MLASVGATPVGMPLPQITDALSKGTIDGCVIPWEVVPSVKVHELTKFHSEFPAGNPALYTTTFVMAMNKAKYDGLAPDLKKVIDANSGMATSAPGWARRSRATTPPAARRAVDRNNTIYHLHAGRSAGLHQAVQPDRRCLGGRHGQARLQGQGFAGQRQGADRQARQGLSGLLN
jgi:TRAP-type C4-dicarboxylate transport system substrate-binding protein